MDEYNHLRNFWMPLIVFSALLGVYLILLGVALAGLVSAQRKRENPERK